MKRLIVIRYTKMRGFGSLIMKSTRLFLDTAFVQALLNRKDQYHKIAKARLSELRTAKEVWTTQKRLWNIHYWSSYLAQPLVASSVRCVDAKSCIFIKYCCFFALIGI